MNQKNIKTITDYIFKEVFGVDNLYTLEELKKKFAFDIPMAKKRVCDLSGETTWSFDSPEEKIASQSAIADRFKKDEWLRKKRPLRSIQEIMDAWREINYLTGEKYINSKDVFQSDGVYNSASVYQSVSIFGSKNIVFGYKIFDSNYLLASRDDSSCTLGIRIKESLFCSSSFEVTWSNKVSQSMFIHDGYDLFACLFCSHLRTKKYCVANMQFEKDEYFKIKKIVIDWILNDEKLV